MQQKGNELMDDLLKDSWAPSSKVSEKIRSRIKKAGKRFHSNDNISEYIEDGEMDLLQAEVQEKLQGVLDSLVIDTENDHNTNETAKRVAKMYIRETFGGRFKPAPRVTSFPNMGYKSMYTSGPISIRSTCAHHFQNIVGRAWVGIIPNGEVIGLSKFNRIVHHIVERPQIQEEMTTQIADELKKYAKTENLAVVVKAEHHCMTHRGVREHESDMTTAIMLGAFKDDPATRDEFYKICMSMKGHGENKKTNKDRAGKYEIGQRRNECIQHRRNEFRWNTEHGRFHLFVRRSR